jgi:hypothetical protein
MGKLLMAGAAATALIAISISAQAGIERTFSGSGASGFLDPAGSSEPWVYGNPAGGSDVGWGSPGVLNGETASNETVPVTDFEITFASALDPAVVGVPGPSATTVFLVGNNFWTADFDPATPDSITFTAPARSALEPGEDYAVNVFLLRGDGVSGEAFSGAWTTASTVPEPASLALLGVRCSALA